MELLSWIDSDKLQPSINRNINAIRYLEQHPELVNKKILVQNENYKLLDKDIRNPFLRQDIIRNSGVQMRKIIQYVQVEKHRYYFCRNPHCMDVVKSYPISKDLIALLSQNVNAVDLLEEHIEFIHWDSFCLNESPKAIEIIMRHPEKINWLSLSSNPSAIKILEDNLDKIDYWGLSFNYNAIHLIEQFPEKINWIGLSGNKNALHILEKNRDKIEWHQFSGNPGIFEYNYQKESIRRTRFILGELMAKAMHPSKIEYWLSNGMTVNDLPE
jgi:hypothetical protein